MPRRLRILAGVALLFLLLMAGLFALRQVNIWRYDNALAEAEAWNRTEWANGTALVATLETRTTLHDNRRNEQKTVTCFRKKLVSQENGLLPKIGSRIAHRALTERNAFSIFTEDRVITGIGTQSICDNLFQKAIPALPATLRGDILIEEIPKTSGLSTLSDGTTIDFSADVRRCRIEWTSDTPVSIEGGVWIAPVTMIQVERVPLKTALTDATSMGPASELRERFRMRLRDGNVLPPAYQWSQDQLCWLRASDGICEARADDICGIPKL